MTIKTYDGLLAIAIITLISFVVLSSQIIFLENDIKTQEEISKDKYERAVNECMNLETRDHCLKFYGDDVYQKYYESN